MTDTQINRALLSEARRLNASELLFRMAKCCAAANGYEAGLRCLKEGIEIPSLKGNDEFKRTQ